MLADSVDANLLAWRRSTAAAALDFLDAISEPEQANHEAPGVKCDSAGRGNSSPSGGTHM